MFPDNVGGKEIPCNGGVEILSNYHKGKLRDMAHQEHIELRSGEGACNSACYPCIRRNSKMADVF